MMNREKMISWLENQIKILEEIKKYYENKYSQEINSILPEEERKYLKDFIKSFIDNIVEVRLGYNPIWIEIHTSTNGWDNYLPLPKLPTLKSSITYKGMEVGKWYTLKELGIDYE